MIGPDSQLHGPMMGPDLSPMGPCLGALKPRMTENLGTQLFI